MGRGKRKAVAQASLLASRRFVSRMRDQAKATLAASAAGLTQRARGAAARAGAAEPESERGDGERTGGRRGATSRGGQGGGAAGRGAGSRSARRAPLSDAARLRLREMGAIALLGFTLFLFLACVSAYGEGNLCGPTGEWLGSFLLGSFGYAAYLIVVCLALWGGTVFLRRQPESFSIRFMGLVLCLVALAGLLAHFLGSRSGNFPAGGTVGEYIHHQLRDVGGLGTAGTRIALIVLTLMTFVLATDVAYYSSVMATVGWVQRQRARRTAASGGAQLTPTNPRLGSALDVDAVGAPRPLAGDLAPFKALEHVPGASIPEAAVDGGRASRARKPAGAGADTPAIPAAPAAPEKAARSGRNGAGEVTGAPPGSAARADKPSQPSAPAPASMAKPQTPAIPDVGDDADIGAAVDESPAASARGAGAPGASQRPAPRVRRSADDLPVQKTLYGETAVPPAIAAAAATGPTSSPYIFPGDELLDEQESVDQVELDALLAQKTATLERTLESFKVDARVVEIQKGPVISMFEMELAPGIKVEKVRSLEDDLAIALRARSVRIVAPIPGKNTIGIEVPNPLRETVRLKPLLHCREFTEGKYALPIFLGRDASGRPMVVDLARMPHLLVAGATGSGKSVCLNSILVSFLYTRSPEQLKLILIDPKMVELTQFGNAPHLACPVVSDMKRAPGILEWAIMKMEDRYKLLSQAGVRNVYSYNKLGTDGLRPHFGERVDDPDFPRFLPFIVIVIDELADLMMSSAKEVETSITRLAAKSRAVGIHLIVATQRPSTNVITGLIKANLPTRIGFMVSSKIDSRVILDENGAEQLLGEGDMLLMSPQSSALVRGQGTFLSEEEVHRVMDMVKTSSGPGYEPELVQRKSAAARDPDEEDELYDAAVRFVFSTERGSASLLQRKFAIGYTRASRLIDMMAEEGVLGEYKGSQARELTLTQQDWVALKPEARGTEADRGPGGARDSARADAHTGPDAAAEGDDSEAGEDENR